MDLALDDGQLSLVESITSLFEKHSTPAHVRRAEERGFDPELWTRVQDFGLVAMGVPEDADGGAGLVDLALVAEQAGRFLASVPVVEAVVAARLLARAGAPAGPALASAMTADAPVVLAVHPARNGIFALVPGGSEAGVVIGLDGSELVAVAAPPSATRLANIAAAPLADRDARAGTRTVLAFGPDAQQAYAAALSEWKALTGALLVGLAHGALDLAVEYAKTRHQFGVPIGSFQALSHRLADDATALAGAELLAREAAWAVDDAGARGDAGRQGTTAPIDDVADLLGPAALASMAFVFSAETAQRVTATSLHVHGGMGFATETDVQLFFRRAQGWPQVGNGVRDEYRHLADAVFGAAGRS